MKLGTPPFENRRDAGQHLAAALAHLKAERPVVLALPRGGVPVGYEVSKALAAPLDVLLVRKLAAPGLPELGIGAVADTDPPQTVLNDELVHRLQPPHGYVEQEAQRQLAELSRRRKLYCEGRAPLPVHGRTVIVVDDGIATGATMKAALSAVASAGASRLLFAAPVAAREPLITLRDMACEGICLLVPEFFRAVSPYYGDFEQTEDDEVIRLLRDAARHFSPSG